MNTNTLLNFTYILISIIVENLYNAIANLLDNFDNNRNGLNDNNIFDDNEIEEEINNGNNFNDVLVQLSTKDSLNPKGNNIKIIKFLFIIKFSLYIYKKNGILEIFLLKIYS